jgi:hypothetical protein
MGRTVLIVPLKVEAGKNMVIPVGTLRKRLVSKDGSVEQGPEPDALTLGNGSAIFEFSIPEMDRAYKADKLTLHFDERPPGAPISGVSGPPNAPDMPVSGKPGSNYTIDIYDWKSGTWHKLDSSSNPLEIDNAENFISRDGKIKARVSTSLRQVNIRNFDFEVVGKWQ